MLSENFIFIFSLNCSSRILAFFNNGVFISHKKTLKMLPLTLNLSTRRNRPRDHHFPCPQNPFSGIPQNSSHWIQTITMNRFQWWLSSLLIIQSLYHSRRFPTHQSLLVFFIRCLSESRSTMMFLKPKLLEIELCPFINQHSWRQLELQKPQRTSKFKNQLLRSFSHS